jgi:Kinesin motor domain
MEGAEINTSLLALKEVLRAMSSSDSTHVPFRGSKLTQILKESLVDASSTCVMIACVCPNMSHCEPTLNTLRYANCLKELEKSKDTNRPRPGPKQPDIRPIRTPPVQNSTIRSPPAVTINTHLASTTPSPSIPSRTSSAISEVSADASAVLDDILSSPGETGGSPTEQAASHDRQLRAAQSLLHSHKESMTAMLAMAKDEMTLVCNHSGESLEATLQYMEETQSIQARQLACIATLREALLQYYEACESDGGTFSNESFEDLRD